MIRPTDYFIEDFEYTKDDDYPLIIEIFLNDVAHNMTGSLIEIIITDNSGTVVKTLSSATGSIVINNSELTIDPAVFTSTGKSYSHKFRETAGGNIATIGKGNWIVKR
jgi:hypothetical protein